MALIKTMTKGNLGRKGLILLPCPRSQSIIRGVRAGTQGRNLEAGTESEAKEDAAYWLASHGLVSLILYIPGLPA